MSAGAGPSRAIEVRRRIGSASAIGSTTVIPAGTSTSQRRARRDRARNPTNAQSGADHPQDRAPAHCPLTPSTTATGSGTAVPPNRLDRADQQGGRRSRNATRRSSPWDDPLTEVAADVGRHRQHRHRRGDRQADPARAPGVCATGDRPGQERSGATTRSATRRRGASRTGRTIRAPRPPMPRPRRRALCRPPRCWPRRRRRRSRAPRVNGSGTHGRGDPGEGG